MGPKLLAFRQLPVTLDRDYFGMVSWDMKKWMATAASDRLANPPIKQRHIEVQHQSFSMFAMM